RALRRRDVVEPREVPRRAALRLRTDQEVPVRVERRQGTDVERAGLRIALRERAADVQVTERDLRRDRPAERVEDAAANRSRRQGFERHLEAQARGAGEYS